MAAPFFDGVEAWAMRKAMIRDAQHTICVQTFIIDNDPSSEDLVDLLCKKAKEGVQVRLLLDGMGTRPSKHMLQRLREAGADVRVREESGIFNLWHEKIIIVDSEHAIVGGLNFGDMYALGGTDLETNKGEKPFQDTDLLVRGSIVQDVVRGFAKNCRAAHQPLEDGVEEQLLSAVRPVDNGDTTCRFIQNSLDETLDTSPPLEAYFHLIGAAQHSVTLQTPYFLPPPSLSLALIDAAERNVKVRILIPNRATNDHGTVADAARTLFAPLIAAGVEIYELQSERLHAKTATFDGQTAIVGSMNLNRRSENKDTECIMVVRSEQTAREVEDSFERRVKDAQRVELTDIEKATFGKKLRWKMSALFIRWM
jgi:cardiolipin synthase A/B